MDWMWIALGVLAVAVVVLVWIISAMLDVGVSIVSAFAPGQRSDK